MIYYKEAQETSFTTGYWTVTTSYIIGLCGISYILYPLEFRDLIYQAYTDFLQDYYTHYDSTGPFSIAQV